MLELNESDFDQQVARGNFVVDFSAEWCPPCRMLKPIFQRAATSLAPNATFAEVDADSNSGLLQRFGVQALPTIIVFRNGKPIHTIRGLRDEKSIIAEVRNVIAQD